MFAMEAIRPSRVEWRRNYEKCFLKHENISFSVRNNVEIYYIVSRCTMSIVDDVEDDDQRGGEPYRPQGRRGSLPDLAGLAFLHR